MPDDAELLRRYAATRAEDAFAELVRRHLDGVYSAALRRVGGDTHLAEMNHSARFWARVEEVCPGWREAERWLKRNGSLLGL